MTRHSIPEAGDGQGSTDNPDELFDLVDEQDNVIGQVRRGDAHTNPALLHRSVQTLVFDGAGRILLQLRSARKDLFPRYYCASASGHVLAGEDYESTAARELQEELGVSAPLTYVGKSLARSAFESEMTALFLARCDGPFHFDPVETDGGEFFAWDEVLAARDHLPMTPSLLIALEQLQRLLTEGAVEAPR